MSRLQTTQGTVRFDWQRQRWPDPTPRIAMLCFNAAAFVIVVTVMVRIGLGWLP